METSSVEEKKILKKIDTVLIGNYSQTKISKMKKKIEVSKNFKFNAREICKTRLHIKL